MAYVKVLRTYRFITKNPVIDEVRTALQDEGLYHRLKDVADLSSLSYATLDGWFHGDTRDPRDSSTAAVMTSIGYERTWKRVRKLNVDEELVYARAWLKKERAKREADQETAPKRRKRRASKKSTKKRAA